MKPWQMMRRFGGVSGGAWVTSGSWAGDGNSAGWGGLTLRQRVESSQLVAGSMLRFTLRSASGTACVIAKAYVQHLASGGGPYAFASTPVPLSFSGSAGVTIAANSEVVSDAVAFSVSPTVPLVVSAYITSGDVARMSSIPGWTSGYKSGDDAATVAASGYSYSAFSANLVRKIEIFQP